ncbi:sugar phosphate nucleotidyltransferase [Polynucleobacter sp. MWH-UH2A]|uniref:sugar phosphate nucleotidyltransferase n=1 Tax=Polynucleobacter sp. MWH-UH2A TaxID=1855617 RepID=UPI00203BAA76|nr:sugar phosphate nucleotidyltransferase [Polynucleobacter sp. MWH-UH2A]QWD65060.1 NTP transferase domain-containing protein [Polynucleobacter sp. MWH-UH2A]
MSKRAIILAGGKGTRLRPYTVVLPKPLMPIGQYPILEVIIRQLSRAGFDHVTLAVNHQAEIIKAFFQDGQKWGIKIDYSLEENPLGTMGPLKLIKELPKNFLVMNGDILTNLDFSAFFDRHVVSGKIFTISSMLRKHKIDYGVLETNPNQMLIGMKEKPEVEYQVSMGIYMLSNKILDHIPENTPFGFDSLMLRLLEIDESVAVTPFTGYWLDIGRPDDYEKAIDEFERVGEKFING